MPDYPITVGPIAKPHIWLEGTRVDVSGVEIVASWSGRVDHAIDLPATSSTIIGAVTNFDQQNIITFHKNVRIVIQQKVTPKPDYHTEYSSLPLSTLIKEGAPGAGGFQDGSGQNVIATGQWAETYFTINGKDPVRTKAYLNKYPSPDPTDEILDDPTYKWENLGFILASAQTGSDLITIKARTYYQGNKSRIAVARFKIARDIGEYKVGNAVPIEGV